MLSCFSSCHFRFVNRTKWFNTKIIWFLLCFYDWKTLWFRFFIIYFDLNLIFINWTIFIWIKIFFIAFFPTFLIFFFFFFNILKLFWFFIFDKQWMIFICFLKIIKINIFLLVFNIHHTMLFVNHMLLASHRIFELFGAK